MSELKNLNQVSELENVSQVSELEIVFELEILVRYTSGV